MRYSWAVQLGVVVVLAMPGVAWASRIDDLIADLGGRDDVARSRARQLLPRESIEAVPKLLPLVRQDDAAVWRAAFNTLMDFAAEVSAPGREAERVEVTRHLMMLVAPGETPVVKRRGLRLLPLVVPAGYDVAPMAALLADDDPVMAEKARAALQETGTPEAAAALCAFLARARPEFQCAILNALGEMKDAGSLTAIDELTRSGDARVRAAAARALAWTGDAFRLKTVKAVVAAADETSRHAAADALIRLVNAIEERGGNWEIVVAAYAEMLADTDRTVKEAGLAGLGRIGDGSCVGRVLAAIAEAEAPTWQIGVDALRQMQGVDVTKALVAEYPKQPERLRPALLGALGAKKSSLALPILTEAAQAGDGAVRLAALEALRDTELPEGLPVLIAAGNSTDAAERATAQRCIVSLAGAMRARGKTREAGAAYVAAMEAASNDVERRAILDGLAACPVTEALPVLKKMANNQELVSPAARALVATAGALTAAKRQPEALEALELARKLDASPEILRLVAAGMRDAGAAGEYAAMLGLITDWRVVGPFELGEKNSGWDKAYISEPDVSLTAKYMSGKRRVEWQRMKAPDDRGVFDLHKALGKGDNLIGYVYAEVTVEKETDAVLLVGADDSERVWVNGQKVFELFMPRGITPDEDKINVKLKAGKNVILMKIWQNTLGWEFCARLTTPDGKAIAFTQQQ